MEPTIYETSIYNQGISMSQVNAAIVTATSQLATGYTPKGEASVATLNGLTGQENGELYTMTDAGTLTDGSLAVVAGDTVAWDATNEVWYKAMDYAPSQYGTNEVHNLSTTITAFRTGDVIPVDGPDGTAKMTKDDLLRETAENALLDIDKNIENNFWIASDFTLGPITLNSGLDADGNYTTVLGHGRTGRQSIGRKVAIVLHDKNYCFRVFSYSATTSQWSAVLVNKYAYGNLVVLTDDDKFCSFEIFRVDGQALQASDETVIRSKMKAFLLNSEGWRTDYEFKFDASLSKATPGTVTQDIDCVFEAGTVLNATVTCSDNPTNAAKLRIQFFDTDDVAFSFITADELTGFPYTKSGYVVPRKTSKIRIRVTNYTPGTTLNVSVALTEISIEKLCKGNNLRVGLLENEVSNPTVATFDSVLNPNVNGIDSQDFDFVLPAGSMLDCTLTCQEYATNEPSIRVQFIDDNNVAQSFIYAHEINEFPFTVDNRIVPHNVKKIRVKCTKGVYGQSIHIGVSATLLPLEDKTAALATILFDNDVSSKTDILQMYPEGEYLPKVATLRKKIPYGSGAANCVNTPVCWLWFSDIHGDIQNFDRLYEWYKRYSLFVSDILNTGDTVLADVSNIDEFDMMMDACSGKMLVTLGNHDVTTNPSKSCWTGEDTTIKDIYDLYMAKMSGDLGVVRPVDASTYGYNFYYKDYLAETPEPSPNKGNVVRLIVLDSCISVQAMVYGGSSVPTADTSAYEAAQLSWFESVLADARTNDYSVVVAVHSVQAINELESDTGFTNVGHTYDPSEIASLGDDYLDAVDDFITNGGEFVTWLVGHVHTDHTGTIKNHPNQLLIAITTASPRRYYTNAVQPYRTGRGGEGGLDKTITKTTDAFEMIAVDTLSKIIRIARIGTNFDSFGRPIDMVAINYNTKAIVGQ